ncbi:MAG: DUF4145 domain-containing protein [Flavobacterium sp.]
MDVKTWTQRFFYEGSKIEWHCPNCGAKSLEILKDKFVSEETQDSRNMRLKDDNWETNWIELNISGQMQCKNCKEFVFFIGKGNPEEFGYYDPQIDDYVQEVQTSFIPLYVYPTIHIFEIPEKCPTIVKDGIIESFNIYWTDLESCANKIRISLEHLMDSFKIKKFTLSSQRKRIPLTLHSRINLFPISEVKDILLAIKWIGNAGSHSKTSLETIDIIETYKLYEFALQKIYGDEKEIAKIAKQIIEKKGKRKRNV